MRKLFLFLSVLLNTALIRASDIITENKQPGSFVMVDGKSLAAIYVDNADFETVKKTAALFQHDIEMVTGKRPVVINAIPDSAKNIIIIGTIGRSALINQLTAEKKIHTDAIAGKWEAYQLQTIAHPFKGIENALVITGSDRRGVAYGVFELSKQIGVSPWYWWADVPVKKKTNLFT